jgi:nitroimidazol reductase NimA-like FMN-containing flavoprotein (pyridoxamine 5'-phosphate oxidase superfamily)
MTIGPPGNAVAHEPEPDGRIDQVGAEVLSSEECLRLLSSVRAGRILFTDRALPAVQPVYFVVDDRSVVIRTSPGSRLATAVPGAVVAFEVDQIDSPAEGDWNVTVIGPAEVVTGTAERERMFELPLRAWTAGRRDEFIRVRAEIMQGRRLRS